MTISAEIFLPKPNWVHYLAMPRWALGEAVCLSIGVHPVTFIFQKESGQIVRWFEAALEEWAPRIEIFGRLAALSDEERGMSFQRVMHNGVLSPVFGEVKPREFVAYCVEHGLEIPEEMRGLYSGAARRGAEGEWPWGAYTTRDLDVLKNAVAKFWASYDPASGIAPKRTEVVSWLMSQNVAEKKAIVMASIIRGKVTPGPRRRKRGP